MLNAQHSGAAFFVMLFPELYIPQDETASSIHYSTKVIARLLYIRFNSDILCTCNINFKFNRFVRFLLDRIRNSYQHIICINFNERPT